jgi:hypothetical protein
MRMVAKIDKRLALLFAIFLVVFSTGIVIAHQCNPISSNQITMQQNHSDHGSAPMAATKSLNANYNSERLMNTGCAALFIFVLLFGRKLLNLKAPSSPLNRFMILSRELLASHRPQVFHLALTRPQLGVIRI